MALASVLGKKKTKHARRGSRKHRWKPGESLTCPFRWQQRKLVDLVSTEREKTFLPKCLGLQYRV